jgi:hypothetical protein
MALFTAASSAPRISREGLSLWTLASSRRFIINCLMLPALLIFLYRIKAKVTFATGVVQAVKVRAQVHAVVAARALYFVLHELRVLLFLCDSVCHYLFCFQFRLHSNW